MKWFLFDPGAKPLLCLPLVQAYEKQKKAERSENHLEATSEQRERVANFKKNEGSIVSKPINPFTSGVFTAEPLVGMKPLLEEKRCKNARWSSRNVSLGISLVYKQVHQYQYMPCFPPLSAKKSGSEQ